MPQTPRDSFLSNMINKMKQIGGASNNEPEAIQDEDFIVEKKKKKKNVYSIAPPVTG